MGVVQERQGNEAELARAWVEGRARVLRAVERSFPAAGSVLVEAAVDQAWVELCEQGSGGSPERLRARWRGLAYLRVLNGIRGRHRHFIDSVTLEELDEADALGESDAVLRAGAALRAEARAQEIVRQVSGDARRWLELVIDAPPQIPPREVARTLGWDREKLKSVARRTRVRLREFVAARASGVICERRQAVMEAFAATQLVQRDPAHAARLEQRSMLGSELYEQVALHIAGCEECERAWRQAQRKLLRPRLVFVPLGVYGKLLGAGGSALAVGRRVFGSLARSLSDLRMRVGLGIGRATAGGAAGTAGTAGALAGKGAVVCVGVLCAAGAGTAALVGLPPSIISHEIASHHHHKAVVAHRSQSADRPSFSVASRAVGAMDHPAAAQSEIASTRASKSRPSNLTARTIYKSTRPATPGDLIANSSTASSGASKPTASVARAASTRTSAEPTDTQATSATRSSPVRTTRASSSPCLPGSLGC